MGLFDEIMIKCPKCSTGFAYYQTKQFKGACLRTFWLDSESSRERMVEEIDEEDLKDLKKDLEKDKLYCHNQSDFGWSGEGCGHSWYFYSGKLKKKQKMVEEFFNLEYEE